MGSRTDTARRTHSGSGYAVSRMSDAGPFYGPCEWCEAELGGRGRLACLENGFDPKTLDPTYGPAAVVCGTCDSFAREFGRLRI